MKLKQLPADFIVEEIPDIETANKGAYALYELEKKGIDTLGAIGIIARTANLNPSAIGYAGLKDKHAHTKQIFSVPVGQRFADFKDKSLSVRMIGFSEEPISLGKLKGNTFTITVRALNEREFDSMQENATHLDIGIPNYYDSQRFGSVSEMRFIARYVAKKDFESAVKLYLTGVTRSDPAWLKREREDILRHWPAITGIICRNRAMQGVINAYGKTGDWLLAYQKIPRNMRQLYLSCFQSYIWNECIKLIVKKNKTMYNVKYAAGSLFFYKELDDANRQRLPKEFRTVSEKDEYSGIERKLIEKVLKKLGLTIPDFDIEETGDFFPSHARQVLLHPKSFTIVGPAEDELNKGLKKAIISFSLPKGAYATIVTKRLFGK
jgi:tRNA pseudouridine13 synthase